MSVSMNVRIELLACRACSDGVRRRRRCSGGSFPSEPKQLLGTEMMWMVGCIGLDWSWGGLHFGVAPAPVPRQKTQRSMAEGYSGCCGLQRVCLLSPFKALTGPAGGCGPQDVLRGGFRRRPRERVQKVVQKTSRRPAEARKSPGCSH